jgi:LysR family transcriptional regulator, glycine cleavage system transcriptional activator
MARPLPPLNQLRAFEVAARHLSFSRAAMELCVTPAAVSHHIRALEEFLHCKLFDRLTRRLALTLQGEALLPVVQESFANIALEIRRLRADAGRQHLSVRMPPFLSAWWLTPRLSNFVKKYPGIEISLEHSTAPVDFRIDDVDIAIHWTPPHGVGIFSELFIVTRRIPTCTKSLLSRHGRLKRADDISEFNLLHEFSYSDWEQWYVMQGLDPAGARRGFVFDNYEVLLRAVIAGQGIALLMSSRFGTDVDYQGLDEPFGHQGPDFAYNVLYPDGALDRPVVSAFRAWLFEQARASLQ